jgi:hypothetical protein
MANLLKDFQARRNNYLLNPADKRAALLDNAPVGSAGAAGGLLASPQQQRPSDALGGLLGASAFVPGIGDFTGPMSDAYMYATNPQSRTAGNFAMSALGLLPMIPSVGAMKLDAPYFLKYMDQEVPPLSKSWLNQDPKDFAKWAIYDAKGQLSRSKFADNVDDITQEIIEKKARESWPDAAPKSEAFKKFVEQAKEAAKWVLPSGLDSFKR